MFNLKTSLVVHVWLFILCVSSASAQMSSTNYRISSTVMSGGGTMMSSQNYQLISTLGQSAPTGNNSSPSFVLYSGFQYTMLVNAVGDVNGDGDFDLEDVITALQITTGQSPAIVIKEADTDGDGKIGLSEALHILRKFGE